MSIMCIIHEACTFPGTRQEAFSLLFKDKETEGQGGKQPDLCLLVYQVQGWKETSLWTLGKTGSLIVYIWEHQQGFHVGQEGVC